MSVLLALKSVMYSPRQFIIAAMALAAALTPLLVLYGLKTGIVSGMLEDLKTDPAVLEISIKGAAVITPQQIVSLRADKDAAFVIGTIRALSSRVEFTRQDAELGLVSVDIAPTAKGDPLAAPSVVENVSQTIISQELAKSLKLSSGDSVNLVATRRSTEEVVFTLTVLSVLSDARIAGKRALVHPALLDDIEAFIDGYELLGKGISGKPTSDRKQEYASMRVFASTLDGVQRLSAKLDATGLRTISKAQNIAQIRGLERAMNSIFLIMSVAAVVGYIISLTAGLSTLFQQEKPHLALLRLLGFSRLQIAIFPLVYGLVIALGGLLVSFTFYAVVATLLNERFNSLIASRNICELYLPHYALAVGFTGLIVLVLAVRQAVTIAAISPVTALKEA